MPRGLWQHPTCNLTAKNFVICWVKSNRYLWLRVWAYGALYTSPRCTLDPTLGPTLDHTLQSTIGHTLDRTLHHTVHHTLYSLSLGVIKRNRAKRHRQVHRPLTHSHICSTQKWNQASLSLQTNDPVKVTRLLCTRITNSYQGRTWSLPISSPPLWKYFNSL